MSETQEVTPNDAVVRFLQEISGALAELADRLAPEIAFAKVNPAVARTPGTLSVAICAGLQFRVLSEVADERLLTKEEFRVMAQRHGYGRGWSQYLSKKKPLMDKITTLTSGGMTLKEPKYRISTKGKARLQSRKTWLLAEGYIHADGSPTR